MLELSLNPTEGVLSQNLRRQIVDETRAKSNRQVSEEIRSQVEKLLQRFNDLMRGERQILHCLAKEKERNSFLEHELSRREQIFSGEKPRHKAARSIQTEAQSNPLPAS